MEQKLFAFFSLSKNLIFFYKVKHSAKGASMYPHAEELDNKVSFFVLNNAFGEEYSETPEADDYNGLKG